jgi:hypothetical protein
MSGHRGFIGACIAFVVFPTHADFVASFSIFEGELQEGVF